MDKSRRDDLEQLRQDYKRETDPGIRKQMVDAGNKITREDGRIGAMRESLIREHRAGRMENVKDIHEQIKNDEGYRNRGR